MLVDGGDPPGDAVPPACGPGVGPEVAVVTVAYGAEPWLECSVGAVLASRGVRATAVVVDNGCTDGAVDRLEGQPGVVVVRPSANLGFAEGCNLGAAASDAPLLALVNPDAVVDPDALARLVDVARRDDVGIATCSLRLADEPDVLNSAGNDVHFLGLSWAGSFRRPAAERSTERDVACASGAGMAVRRDVWDELGGFCPEFFAYQEDAELSLRSWIGGRRVVFVPDAVVVHRYEFSRNPTKFFLLDRNRLLLVLTLYQRRTLALLAPLLVLQELGMFVLAIAQGWWRQRLRSVAWILRHRSFVRERRRQVARTRRRGDAVLVPLLAPVVEPGNYPLPRWVVLAQAPLVLYWRLVSRSFDDRP